MTERSSHGNEGSDFRKTEGGPDFDREGEKEHRKEIRKVLTLKISESLADSEFKREGSYWYRKAGNKWNIVYLQRGQFAHNYYINAGVCEVSDSKKKPRIEDCYGKKGESERIEHIVSKANLAKDEYFSDDPEIKREKKEKVLQINSLLDFEAPGSREKYPGEYFVPSVNMDTAKGKIEEIGDLVKEYIPKWFDKIKSEDSINAKEKENNSENGEDIANPELSGYRVELPD